MGALDVVRAAKPQSALDQVRAASVTPAQSALDRVRAAATPPPAPAVPEAPKPLLERPGMPPEIEQVKRQAADVRSSMRFQAGIDPELQGNYPAKAAAVAATEQPIEERSAASLIASTPGNFVSGARDLLSGLGTAIVRGAVAPVRAVQSMGDAAAGRTRVTIPDPIAGTDHELVLPARPQDLHPEVVQRLVALGARFGEDRVESDPSLAGDVGDVLSRRGLAVPDAEVAAKYGDRIAVPIPGTDRSIVPRKALEFATQEPVSAALDVSMVAALPGIAARGAGEVAIQAGAAAERTGLRAAAREMDRVAGPVQPNVAQRAGQAAAKAGVRFQEAGEALRELHPLSLIREARDRALAASPAGQEVLRQRAAGAAGSTLINREVDRSIARRIADQHEIGRALDVLEQGDASIPTRAPGAPSGPQIHAAVTEGRAARVPGMQTEAEVAASRTLREQARAREGELVEGGFLKPDAADARALGPWINARTGKRIPAAEWDDVRVERENAAIAKRNQQTIEDYAAEGERPPPGALEPAYLTPARYQRELDEMRDFRQSWNEFPDAPEFDPAYFPRFPTGKEDAISLRKVAAEFFPKRGSVPGRQPFQRLYTGLSFLKTADPLDVREALVRYNAQVRKVVDSNKMLTGILKEKIDVRQPGGRIVKERLAKPLNFDRRGDPIDLLPGHRPFDPEGMLQFYRGQIDMSEAVAKALDDMGDAESALAQGIREALPDGLSKEWLAVRKRRQIYQVPEALARQLERQFGETHPLLRVWDKATDAWKAAVLAYSPRWYVNNLVGNTVMYLMAGGSPRSLARRTSAEQRAVMPIEMGTRSMAQAEGYIRDLGQARTSMVGAVADAVTNMRPVQWAGSVTNRLLDFNALVDGHFRAKLYLDMGRKEARNALVKRTGRAYFESREILTEMASATANPKRLNRLLDSVDRVFVNFNNLTPIERKVVRRIVPFWSWYREIARVTVSLPKTSPVRAQMARALSGMAQDADEREFEQRVGFPKAWLRDYVGRGALLDVSPEGEVEQMSTRGVNPFADAFTPEIQKLHPAAVRIAEEAFGGRTFDGAFVPFRVMPTGRPDESVLKPGAALRTARNAPFVRQIEDLAQYATEGRVTQRFEDVSPVANVARKALGKPVVPTAVYDYDSREPRRERPASDAVLGQLGIPLQRFLADEQLEQAEKAAKTAATQYARETWRRPEQRAELERQAAEKAGAPYEGIRTFAPKSP